MQITAVRTLTSALAAPALSSAIAGSTATLTWSAPIPTGQSVIAGYRVYKSATLAGTYTQVGGALPPNQLTLSDSLSGSQFYKVESFDQFTAGIRSPGLQCVPQTAGTVRNNVGHYACFDYAGGVNSSRATSDVGIINSTATGTSDNLMGFSWIISWRSIDKGTTSASYDWTVVDQYVNACRAKNKQWWLWLAPFFLDPGGSSSCSAGTRTVPDWLYTQGVSQCQGNMKTGSGATVGGGVYPKYYNTGVKSAIIALCQAFVDRYGSDPRCEGLIFSIGSSIVVSNVVDNLGTKQANINYDLDYSDVKMRDAYIAFMQAFRSMTSVLNLHMSLDYMFYQGDSNSANWTTMLDAIQQYKCIGGGPDCLSKNWVYPSATPAITGSTPKSTFCLTPQPDARFALTQTPGSGTNSCFSRGVSSDQYYVGWKGFPAYKGRIKWGKTQELTEMGGYIGQFSAADCWETSGPKLYNVSYQHWDVNYSPAGNYGMNTAPNTLWNASASYEATYGPSVYTWIKTGPVVLTADPYAS